MTTRSGRCYSCEHRLPCVAALEAVALYEEAEQSFLALLNSDPDAAAKIRAKVGVGSCLTNKALALRGAGDITAAKLAFSRAADWYVQGGSPSDESVARALSRSLPLR